MNFRLPAVPRGYKSSVVNRLQVVGGSIIVYNLADKAGITEQRTCFVHEGPDQHVAWDMLNHAGLTVRPA